MCQTSSWKAETQGCFAAKLETYFNVQSGRYYCNEIKIKNKHILNQILHETKACELSFPSICVYLFPDITDICRYNHLLAMMEFYYKYSLPRNIIVPLAQYNTISLRKRC